MAEEKAPKTILVIDDEPEIVWLISEELRALSYVVKSASQGQEGLELIKQEGIPDLILVDLNMPVMDGKEFSQKITQDIKATIPIIFMTGETLDFREDTTHLLSKPFDLDSLDRIVQDHLKDS